MKITVIICTFNRCESLTKALNSVAASVLPEPVSWEVLVVDNNSSDQTPTVVREFCNRHPERFRYLFEPQQGKSYALNAGIREARGDVLAFADDDAVVGPDWLWSLTSSLHSGEWAGAGGRIIPVWTKPRPSWLSTDDPHTMGPFVAFDQGTESGQLNRPPYGANMAFRKEMFEKYGGFLTELGPRPGSEIKGEDIEFGKRLLSGGERLRYEPCAVVLHPVPECRMKRKYVLRWWFWYGRAEVLQSGLPSDGKWLLSGIPLYLLRRLVRWSLQWMFSIGASRRFPCQRNVWYITGTILACYQSARVQDRLISVASEIPGTLPKRTPPQIGTLR
jgi:glycosyltransferase involved in cell wall biosynthesis